MVYSQTYNVQINLVFTAVFKNLVSINLLKYNKLLEVYCYFNFHRCSNFFLKGKPTNKHSKRIIHASLISAFNFNLLSWSRIVFYVLDDKRNMLGWQNKELKELDTKDRKDNNSGDEKEWTKYCKHPPPPPLEI